MLVLPVMVLLRHSVDEGEFEKESVGHDDVVPVTQNVGEIVGQPVFVCVPLGELVSLTVTDGENVPPPPPPPITTTGSDADAAANEGLVTPVTDGESIPVGDGDPPAPKEGETSAVPEARGVYSLDCTAAGTVSEGSPVLDGECEPASDADAAAEVGRMVKDPQDDPVGDNAGDAEKRDDTVILTVADGESVTEMVELKEGVKDVVTDDERLAVEVGEAGVWPKT